MRVTRWGNRLAVRIPKATPDNRYEELDWGKPEGKGGGEARRPPERGDILWLALSPQPAREQAGRRVGVGPDTGLVQRPDRARLRLPDHAPGQGYPFEVELGRGEISGVALVDQPRSLDRRARKAVPAGTAPAAVMTEVLAKLRPLLGH